MQESLLHFIWQFQYYNKVDLQTCEGESLNILHPGLLNTDAGPDFSNSRIMVGDILWHGHIEIHKKSSEWEAHKHQFDPAYNKVILHVVWEKDKEVYREDGTLLPTLELSARIEDALIDRYEGLCSNLFPIPCANRLPEVKEIVRISMMDKALMQRLDSKSRFARKVYVLNKNDWETTAYQLLAKNFGFKINSEAFFKLSQSLPLKILRRHANSLLQLEALLFGQAGFLDQNFDDSYFLNLKTEYQFLSAKYDFSINVEKHEWKFLRLRPANFPTLRIAQFASLLHKTPHIFAAFKEETDYKELTNLLSVKPTRYWSEHYNFGKVSQSSGHALGKSSVENLIINTIVPLLVAVGHVHDQDEYVERAINFMQHLPPERNRITKLWSDYEIPVTNGFDSQALIEIYNNYCSKKRCLSCNIGTALLKDTPS